MKHNAIIAFAALLLTPCLTSKGAEPQRAPEWQLQSVEGKTVKLSDFKGKVVLLNFWATWCPPCRAEIPDLISLQQQYSPQGLVVIGVAMDQGGATVVKPFLKKMDVNYPVVLGDQKIAQLYGGIEVVPTTFVIDRRGQLVNQLRGAVGRPNFEAAIKPLL